MRNIFYRFTKRFIIQSREFVVSMGLLINFIKKMLSKQESIPKRSYNLGEETLKDSYLLEYRYPGYPKKYILDKYFELKRAHRITHPDHYYVPHITIMGPINTIHESRLIKIIEDILFRNAHHFHEPGNLLGTGKYITFDTEVGGQVLAIEVKPSKALINLKEEIESNLNADESFKCQQYKEEIWHTTLWNMKQNYYSSKEKFQRVWRSLENSPQEMKFILDRITLIKNGMIQKLMNL